MLSLIRIAVRNVLRNTRRSLITMAAVIIGTAVIIFFRGFLNGLQKGLVDNLTNSFTGDVQVHQQGYLNSTDAFPLGLTLDMTGPVQQVIQSDPRVKAAAGRIAFAGQLSNGRNSTLIVGQGIDPSNEYLVVPDARSDWLIAQGQALGPDNHDGVVVSQKLADAMELALGDSVQITATTQAGGFEVMDVTILGILNSAQQGVTGYESKTVYLPLALVQQTLGMENQVTEIVLSVEPFDEIDDVTGKLAAAAAKHPEMKAEVTDWKAAAQFFVDVLNIQNVVLDIVTFVLLLVIVTGIVNTMLMSVFERVREIGTMMAIGVRRNKILTMFMVESVALGTLGAFVGLVVGVTVVSILGVRGFLVTPASSPRPVQLYPFIHGDYLVFILGLAVLTSLIAAIYPAWQAARLRPVEALRAN